MELRVKKLSENATLPTRAHPGDAGYDLYAAHDAEVPWWKAVLIKTDIAVAIPNGYYGRIAPRSSLAYKNGIRVEAGVIDSGYRNNIGVIVTRHPWGCTEAMLGLKNSVHVDYFPVLSTDPDSTESTTTYIKKGDRIAQLIITKIATPKIVSVDTLDDTKRGQGGFGSTGT